MIRPIIHIALFVALLAFLGARVPVIHLGFGCVDADITPGGECP
jgi:hypothetical protein